MRMRYKKIIILIIYNLGRYAKFVGIYILIKVREEKRIRKKCHIRLFSYSCSISRGLRIPVRNSYIAYTFA